MTLSAPNIQAIETANVDPPVPQGSATSLNDETSTSPVPQGSATSLDDETSTSTALIASSTTSIMSSPKPTNEADAQRTQRTIIIAAGIGGGIFLSVLFTAAVFFIQRRRRERMGKHGVADQSAFGLDKSAYGLSQLRQPQSQSIPVTVSFNDINQTTSRANLFTQDPNLSKSVLYRKNEIAVPPKAQQNYSGSFARSQASVNQAGPGPFSSQGNLFGDGVGQMNKSQKSLARPPTLGGIQLTQRWQQASTQRGPNHMPERNEPQVITNDYMKSARRSLTLDDDLEGISSANRDDTLVIDDTGPPRREPTRPVERDISRKVQPNATIIIDDDDDQYGRSFGSQMKLE